MTANVVNGSILSLSMPGGQEASYLVEPSTAAASPHSHVQISAAQVPPDA